jgi:hypothetical protein
MPARLYCDTGPLAGSEFIIEEAATIGRHADNDITLPSPVVSSHHARIRRDAASGTWVLEDLDSYNGTMLDGSPVPGSAVLRTVHRVTFGRHHHFVFEPEIPDRTVVSPDAPPSDGATVVADGGRTADIPVGPVGLTWDSIRSTVEAKNLVVRNLQVTQGYYRISEGMRRLVPGADVSWCSFATHASKTAGQALRHELMPRLLKSAMVRLAGFDNTFVYLSEALGHDDPDRAGQPKGRLGEAMRLVSLLVSEGNIMVFDELAWPFTVFINTFTGDRRRDEAKLAAFLETHFRAGPIDEDGQDHLIEAFTAYYEAHFETDEKRRSEFMFLGNLLVGLHEQTRLQPQIEQALAVPLDVFLDPERPDRREKNRFARQLVTRITTQMLMSITLPSRTLKLTHDVVAPTGVISFPMSLLTIENARCHELVRRFEGRMDTLSGSAAVDWVNLSDRMRFVVDFFRSHQQYPRLWEAPFLPAQVRVIDAAGFPAGPL